MEISYAVMADYANISREGKLNIMGIFDIIYSPSFPTRHPNLFIVASIRAEPLDKSDRDRQIKVVLYDPDRQEILAIQGRFNFKNAPSGELGSSNSILSLNGISFKNPGAYTFSFFIDNVLKKEIPLKVIKPS